MRNYDVDFDTSMGKGDPFSDNYFIHFTQSLKKTHDIHKNFIFLQHFTPEKLLKFAQEIYEKYKPSVTDPSDLVRIPRVFHHIWIGKKPFPAKYKKWQAGWQAIPGWEYKLWTDKDVEQLNFSNKDVYYREENLGARADILRMEILYRFGGVYIDTDLECHAPEMFEFLNTAYDFYCGLHPMDTFFHYKIFALNNAIIGSIPGHPILQYWIEQRRTVNPKAIVVEKGPAFFTKAVLAKADQGYRDIIFPASFFYPVGNLQMNIKPYNQILDVNKRMEVIKQEACKPETIAIHWWDGSWTLPDAWGQTKKKKAKIKKSEKKRRLSNTLYQHRKH